MQRDETAVLVSFLAAIWPRIKAETDIMAVWFEILEPYDLTAMLDAAKTYARSSKHPPTPADLIEEHEAELERERIRKASARPAMLAREIPIRTGTYDPVASAQEAERWEKAIDLMCQKRFAEASLLYEPVRREMRGER